MRYEAYPRTAEEHVNSLTTRVERLELRRPEGGGGGGGTGATVYVQPNEPTGTPQGTLWFDTDETC